jgi:hypothetical protein
MTIGSCVLNVWVVEIPFTSFHAGLLYLCSEVSGVPTSCLRSRFALGMSLSLIQSGADVRQTQQHAAFSGRNMTSSGPPGHKLTWTAMFMYVCFNTPKAVWWNITHCCSPVTQNPLFGAANVHVAYSCWLDMSMLYSYVPELLTASR